MFIVRITTAITLITLLAITVGCQQQTPDLAELMRPAERPAELDALDQFVGHWQGSGEVTMIGSDEVMTGKTSSTYEWIADKWLLVERYEYGDGEKHGVGYYRWDPIDKIYRGRWFDNAGFLATAEITYDGESRTWHYEAVAQNQYTGTETHGVGDMTMIEDGVLQGTWAEYLPGFPEKILLAETKMTNRRQ